MEEEERLKVRGGRCNGMEGWWGFGGVGGGVKYPFESITPHANEEIIYLSISTKLFTLSLPFACVHVRSDRWLRWEKGDEPALERCVCKLNNKLFTSFISRACSSLVSTFKPICHPLSHSSLGAFHFVSHLYFCVPSLSEETSVFGHETRQSEDVTDGGSTNTESVPVQLSEHVVFRSPYYNKRPRRLRT